MKNLTTKSDAAFTRPATLSGWYERIDGTVTRFDWGDGGNGLKEGVTVANWAAVSIYERALEEAMTDNR